MDKLSKFDKDLIKRREAFIKVLLKEKHELTIRINEIDKMIDDYRRWNRELKELGGKQ